MNEPTFGGEGIVMEETPTDRPGSTRRARARDAIGLIVAWGVCAVLSVALFDYVRHYSRNIPIGDEFGMVSVMTGFEPISLRWAWSQHNEHRPMIPRLILAGLFRCIGNDFRVPRYANAALLSAMAASMLVLARRLRGSTRATDAVLPLSILNIGQAESLMIGFAMNLILTSLIAVALVATAGLARRGAGRSRPSDSACRWSCSRSAGAADWSCCRHWPRGWLATSPRAGGRGRSPAGRSARSG